MEAVPDFNKYYSPEEVEGYELFIGRKGEYYKVKKINGEQVFSHYEWANEYVKVNNTEKNILPNTFDALNILIHKYGFIRYAHRGYSPNPILDIPNPSYHGMYITRAQINSIYKLLDSNLEYLTMAQEEMLSMDSYVLNTMSEKVYQKIISK